MLRICWRVIFSLKNCFSVNAVRASGFFKRMSPDQRMQEFVSLLTNHQEVLRSYIIAQIPGSPDVRDVLQDVNIFLWKKMNDFEPGTNFGAWACTVAYYKVLDYRKVRKRNGFLVFSEELCHSLAEDSAAAEPDGLEAKRQALQHCLAKLNPKDRQVLESRYRCRSTNDAMGAIAATTGRSKASLRVTLCRLRTVLRECITKRLVLEGGSA